MRDNSLSILPFQEWSSKKNRWDSMFELTVSFYGTSEPDSDIHQSKPSTRHPELWQGLRIYKHYGGWTRAIRTSLPLAPKIGVTRQWLMVRLMTSTTDDLQHRKLEIHKTWVQVSKVWCKCKYATGDTSCKTMSTLMFEWWKWSHTRLTSAFKDRKSNFSKICQR